MVFGVGPRAGEALVTHPEVPLISFTGSTVVGQRIQAMSAPYVKRLSLEVSCLVSLWTHTTSQHSKNQTIALIEPQSLSIKG